MANWLDRQLPDGARILCSPARRCEQTALALGRKYKMRTSWRPTPRPPQLLELCNGRTARPVLVVGHQPTLGQTIAQLLGLSETRCAVKKGAVWWLRTRERDGDANGGGRGAVARSALARPSAQHGFAVFHRTVIEPPSSCHD